jgi:hypothetical protein
VEAAVGRNNIVSSFKKQSTTQQQTLSKSATVLETQSRIEQMITAIDDCKKDESATQQKAMRLIRTPSVQHIVIVWYTVLTPYGSRPEDTTLTDMATTLDKN